MARPGLPRHRKFRRLVAVLRLPEAHVRGLLELLWDSAYENGDPFLGDAADVELAAGWTGEPAPLASPTLPCGAPGRPGLIHPLPDPAFAIHDLWDHAPDYVRKRRQRET